MQTQNQYQATIGAGALIVHNDQILLVQINYGPFKGSWIFPGGLVDSGEHPHEAAIREVKEETGQNCRILGFLAMRHRLFVETPERGNLYLVFRGELSTAPLYPPNFVWPPEEIMNVAFWPIADALQSSEVRPQTKYFISLRAQTPLPIGAIPGPYNDSLYG